MTRTVANAIKKHRLLRNYSQSYVAVQLGMGKSNYSKIENGQCPINIELVYALCHILDIENVTDILPPLPLVAKRLG